MKLSIKHFCKDPRGAAAVEFAILTPVFLLLLTGMLAYGIYFGASLSLQQLAADAARTSIAGHNYKERKDLVEKFLLKNAGAYLLLDGATVEPRFEEEETPTDPTQFRLTLSYNAVDLPIWNLYLPLPLPSKVIEHQATIRNGGI